MFEEPKVHRAGRPRLNVEVSEAHLNRLSTLIPHGLRKTVFSAIIEDLITILEQGNAQQIIGLIIARRLSVAKLIIGLPQED